MRKATAKNAIDFARLYEVKDRFAGRAMEPPAGDGEKGREGANTGAPESSLAEPLPVAEAAVVPFPVEPEKVPSIPPAPLLEAITALRPPGLLASDGAPGAAPAPAFGRLRIGMPRPLHERVRAAAALACMPPTTLVRDLLESAAPHFEPAAPLTELAQVARAVVPETSAGRQPIEVRMQVPASDDLHRRLLQLAALRAQTLWACLLDLLDHRLPR
jgi:hypothetical protein